MVSSTGRGIGDISASGSSVASQASSRSTFWCAACHKVRISSSSRPTGKACCSTARVINALRCSVLGYVRPASHSPTALRETPRCLASPACVSPMAVRSASMVCPKA